MIQKRYVDLRWGCKLNKKDLRPNVAPYISAWCAACQRGGEAEQLRAPVLAEAVGFWRLRTGIATFALPATTPFYGPVERPPKGSDDAKNSREVKIASPMLFVKQHQIMRFEIRLSPTLTFVI